MSSYRPDYPRRDSPPPPPSPGMPPLPKGPPPSSRPYQFGTGPSQVGHDEPGSMQQNGFSFRANHDIPQYPTRYETYRPSYADEQRNTQNEYRLSHTNGSTRDNHHHHHSDRGRRGDRGHRGSYRARPTFQPSSRPLLLASGGDSPTFEQESAGANAEALRFRSTDEFSDSGEASINDPKGQSDASSLSDAEEYEPSFELHGLSALSGTHSNEDQVGSSGLHATENKLESSASAVSVKAESVPPRWSNPEYFTALPPPDDSTRKKKDVVKLIRKARVALTETDDPKSQIVANDDFISLDFEEAPSESQLRVVDSASEFHSHAQAQVASATPSGSRQLNGQGSQHHKSSNGAPGTEYSALTAAQLGPPPDVRIATAIESVASRQKRKRESDDEDDILIPRPPKKPKGRGNFSNGRILDEWRMDRAKNPVPWLLTGAQLPTINPGQRLHQEICDFYSFVKPQEYEHVIRTDLLDRISRAIKKHDSECELRCFGSFAAGLYLPNADMDLVIVSRRFMETGVPSVFRSSNSMHRLGNYLCNQRIADPDSVEVVGKAKVPIIKFVDQITNLKVDISFENDSGLIANDTFQRWRYEFPAMPILVMLIKQFLMMRGLNEVVQGGIGGFSVTCLVVSLLQNLPRVQCGDIVPEQHLGEMLLEFLDFYGNQLDISRTGISMNPPGYFSKPFQHNKLDRIAIMDPNRPDNDISGGSRNITVIFAAFSECHEEILRAMRTPGSKSLLGWMLGGNYSSVLWQRQRLRRLYKENYGRGVQGEGLIRDLVKEEAHHTESKPQRGISNVKKASKQVLKDTSLQLREEPIHELKILVQENPSIVAYVRKATASGNRALYQSMLQKDKMARDHYEASSKMLLATEKWLQHRKILKIWNPMDPLTKREALGKALLGSKLTSYRRLYVLLQEILDSNPQPDWQQIAFPKKSKPPKTKKEIALGPKPEEDLAIDNEERDTAVIKQNLEAKVSKRYSAEKLPTTNSTQSRTRNVSLSQQGSCTQDAIMID